MGVTFDLIYLPLYIYAGDIIYSYQLTIPQQLTDQFIHLFAVAFEPYTVMMITPTPRHPKLLTTNERWILDEIININIHFHIDI